MVDIFTKEKRSEIMSRIRGRDTKPEISFRKALWHAGLRGWRVHYGPHKIDIAFVGRRIAIFLDGCFWHGCPKHYKKPKTGKGYWIPKIEKNRRRDRKTTRTLETEGWRVVRIWEHDLGNSDEMTKQATRIGQLMKGIG